MRIGKEVNSSWWALRIGLGLAALLAGLDKFFNLLTDWSVYLSPLAMRVLPFSAKTLMSVVGPIEMLVGLAILTQWTRIGAYVASAWLLAIALNLVTTGAFLDIAVRDVEMAVAAYALANLTKARALAQSGQRPEATLIKESHSPARAA